MSKKYAIHKFYFMYNDEWFDIFDHDGSLYDIIEDEKAARQRWAALEREALKEYPLEKLNSFNDGNLEIGHTKLSAFIRDDCGLPLHVHENGFVDCNDVPIDRMSDEELLAFLQLVQCNRYIVMEYTVSKPRYVIYTAQQGYLLHSFDGDSDIIWYTYDANDVIKQYPVQYNKEIYEKKTMLSVADLKSPIVQSLISQYYSEIKVNYNADETQGEINFIDSSTEIVTAFNSVLEQPTYLVQQVDDTKFVQISQHPSVLIR